MIDHTGFNVTDGKKSRAFYDAVLKPLGIAVQMEVPLEHTGGKLVLGYGEAGKPDFWIAEGKANEPRLHIAFRAKSHAEVDEFYRVALASGGTDNGPPGIRAHYHPKYYGAFVRDLDGHNIEAVCHV